jgi:hypothetical protein
MIRVIIESPYAGDVEKNVAYAKKCMLDSLDRGEAPFLSHLLYTQVLDDNIPEQRNQGIYAGLAWRFAADKHVFYIDYGKSEGMLKAEILANRNNIPVEYRRIL